MRVTVASYRGGANPLSSHALALALCAQHSDGCRADPRKKAEHTKARRRTPANGE